MRLATVQTSLSKAQCLFSVAALVIIACSAPSAPAPGSAAPRAPEAPATAPAPAPFSLKVAYSTIGTASMPLIITHEAGFFKSQNLEVELVYAEQARIVAASVIAGETPIVQMGGNAVANGVIGGAELVSVATLYPKFNFQVISRPEIQDVRDLRGKRVGIASKGGSSDFAATYVVRQAGLEPDTDVLFLGLGGQAERVAALESGGAEAVLVEVPYTVAARKAGFKTLVDMLDLPFEVPQTNVVTTRSFVAEHPDVVERYLKALLQGIRYYKANKEPSIQIMAKFLKTEDREALEALYQEGAVKGLPEVPYPPEKGFQNLLDQTALTNEKAREFKPRDMYDDRFLRQLEQSGFVRSLYGR